MESSPVELHTYKMLSTTSSDEDFKHLLSVHESYDFHSIDDARAGQKCF